jgi:hypothetical protein
MPKYEKLFNLERGDFLKIYARYISLCFFTIFNNYPVNKLSLECNGVDMETLKKQGFP